MPDHWKRLPTGKACRQLPEAAEGKGTGKKGKAKKGKKKGGKEEEEKDKGKDKGKGKKDKDGPGGAEVPAVQAAGKHFGLELAREQDRAVACLLVEHELQVRTPPPRPPQPVLFCCYIILLKKARGNLAING